jgi:hypothetical protein
LSRPVGGHGSGEAKVALRDERQGTVQAVKGKGMRRKPIGIAIVMAAGVLCAANAASKTQVDNHAVFSGERGPGGKVWSHRTLGSGAAENTVKGLREVLDLGACGVEVDVYYEPTTGKILVRSDETAVTSGNVLTLSTLLANAPPKARIWLDFWNLKDLHSTDLEKAIEQLEAGIENAASGTAVLVESKSAARLLDLPAHVSRILWIEIAPMDGSAAARRRHAEDLSTALADYRRSGASAVSMDYRQYDTTVAETFRNVPVALFTINDPDALQQAVNDPNVKIILTDEPFYDPACVPAAK